MNEQTTDSGIFSSGRTRRDVLRTAGAVALGAMSPGRSPPAPARRTPGPAGPPAPADRGTGGDVHRADHASCPAT